MRSSARETRQAGHRRAIISPHREGAMGAKGEALAKQFEAKAHDAAAVLERLSDADWKKTTAGEKWTVAVVAHHMAASHEGIAQLIKAVASGHAMPPMTMDMLHDMNAKQAKENASVTKAATVALHKKNATAAAATVRTFTDDQFTKSATVLQGMPAMSVEQMIMAILIGHVDEHVGSIRKTVGV
jgi:Mycothiol maleylpyruvate isomerase N-terminal domain